METEQERQIRRRKRIEEMRKAKRRAELLQKWGIPALVAVVVLTGGAGAAAFFGNREDVRQETDADRETEESPAVGQGGGVGPGTEMLSESSGEPDAVPIKDSASAAEEAMAEGEAVQVPRGAILQIPETHDRAAIVGFDDTLASEYGILIDVEENNVLAQKAAWDRMNPASMTKILTVLVAAEKLTEEDMDKKVPITIDITDYCYSNGCSITGYALDEMATVRDLFYGTILPSGADSALALAKYVAGSHEAFTDMMNEKLAELGLAGTSHFTNCVGLYDEEHYTTAYDMAVMLKAAADNALCREVLSAHTYSTVPTEQNPEGLLVSNWFLRRIEDRDTHGEVLCGKTGFVNESGSCAASLSIGNDGKEYICVTAASSSSWKCIADQVELYQRFLPE